MSKLPLSIGCNLLEPGCYVFDLNIAVLGVPGYRGTYVMDSAEPLECTSAVLYLRYVTKTPGGEVDNEKSIALGKIHNLRVVDGLLSCTAHIYIHYHDLYDRILRVMGGTFNMGLLSHCIDIPNRGRSIQVITRILGAAFITEDGKALHKTDWDAESIPRMLEYRRCSPNFMPIVELEERMGNALLSIATDIGIDVNNLSEADLIRLKKIYQNTIQHYRINPMLVGGVWEKAGDTCIESLSIEQERYIMNLIITKLRTPKYACVTATCY